MAQLKASQMNIRPSARLEGLLDTISELSKPSQALLRAIRKFHLTLDEYKRLSEGRFGQAILDLRRSGLLVPVVSQGGEPCYYFPPGISGALRAALQVLPAPAKELQREIADELKSINYPPAEDGSHEGSREEPLSK